MRIWTRTLLAAAALLAGCDAEKRREEDPFDFKRPHPTVRDYQRLSDEILDGIGALAGRFVCLQGISVPARGAGEGLDVTLRHEQAGAILLEVRVTLDTARDGLPFEIGRLRVVVRAEGPQADGVREAIRERMDEQSLWFHRRFEPEETP